MRVQDLPASGTPELARDEVVAACLANGAPHSVKLTEVCLREAALCDAPVLIAAARDAALHIGG